MTFSATYVYCEDKLTAPDLRGLPVDAVRRHDGRCVRGCNGNMLVQSADGQQHVVLGRHLAKRKDVPVGTLVQQALFSPAPVGAESTEG